MPHPCDQPRVTPPPGEPRALLVGRRAGRRWSHRLHRLCYDAISHAWDKSLLVPGFRERIDLMAAWLTRHGSPEDRRVLDLACGTGTLALALAERGFDVVGLDFSPGMLRRARAKARRGAGRAPRFDRADLDAPLPFPDASCDGVVCVAGLQCVADPARLIGEVSRLLRGGGLFLAVVLRPGRPEPLEGASWERLFRALRRLPGWPRFRTCTTDDLLGILTCAGLGLVEALALPATVALLARKERVGTLDPGLGGSRAS